MECACCGESFERKAGGYKRVGLDSRFKGGASASDTIQKHFSVTITPGKAAFICTNCSLTIRSIDVNKTRLEEVEDKFRKIRRPGSYLATKLQASPQVRGIHKRQKVISTKILSSPYQKRAHTKPAESKVRFIKCVRNVRNIINLIVTLFLCVLNLSNPLEEAIY